MCRGGSGESGKLTVINEEGFPIASYSHLPVGLEVKVHIEKRSVLFPTHPVVQVVIIKALVPILGVCTIHMHVQNSVV